MPLFHHESDEAKHYDDYTDTNAPHKAKLTHEAAGAAAAFYAAKKYEEHVAKNGKPPSHALAKELIAGFAGGFLEGQLETRGRDFFDKEKAKHEAKKRAEQALADSGHY